MPGVLRIHKSQQRARIRRYFVEPVVEIIGAQQTQAAIRAVPARIQIHQHRHQFAARVGVHATILLTAVTPNRHRRRFTHQIDAQFFGKLARHCLAFEVFDQCLETRATVEFAHGEAAPLGHLGEISVDIGHNGLGHKIMHHEVHERLFHQRCGIKNCEINELLGFKHDVLTPTKIQSAESYHARLIHMPARIPG